MTDLHTAAREALAAIDRRHREQAYPKPQYLKNAEASLRAALDAVQAQPVARVTVKSIVPGRIDDLEVLRPLPRGQHLLYTAPQAPQPEDHFPDAGKMVPLTDEQIETLWQNHLVRMPWATGYAPLVFARAIERAHGIGGQP